jgi:hypothetical protein
VSHGAWNLIAPFVTAASSQSGNLTHLRPSYAEEGWPRLFSGIPPSQKMISDKPTTPAMAKG